MTHGLEADPVTVTVFLLLFAGVAGIGPVRRPLARGRSVAAA